MARIVGGVTTSHIPAIGNVMNAGRVSVPYWKLFLMDMNQSRLG